MKERSFTIRRAAPSDSSRIIEILQGVAAERIHTAITKPWSVAEQERFIAGLSSREVIHVAETDARAVIGYQVLERWATTLASMSHVGQIGTYIQLGYRGRGVGAALFLSTRDFAIAHGYGKFVIQVRAQNVAGHAFYSRLGFRECGRFARQVRMQDGEEDDEVLMEYFLDSHPNHP